MADVAAVYTLTTPGGTITLNSGGADQYFTSEVGGLDGAPIRAPIDPVPFGQGGIIHDFWRGPRHPTFEGVLLITSTRVMNSILAIRNDMEENLRVALESIQQANGTLAWTPLGEAARSLTVRNDIALDMRHVENYLLRSFAFGLVAGDPDW